MNDQRRQAAIEAGARALRPKAWDDARWGSSERSDRKPQAFAQEEARKAAAAVIDAAAPHLVGEPIGYALVWGGWVSPVRQHSVEDVAAYRERTGMDGAIVALVLVEDAP